jgi:hypothetical protein
LSAPIGYWGQSEPQFLRIPDHGCHQVMKRKSILS